jgi:hypothetical protein
MMRALLNTIPIYSCIGKTRSLQLGQGLGLGDNCCQDLPSMNASKAHVKDCSTNCVHFLQAGGAIPSR